MFFPMIEFFFNKSPWLLVVVMFSIITLFVLLIKLNKKRKR